MLVRDAPTPARAPAGDTQLQVLMVRRNLRSDFVGGAYVFPGGAVDPNDGGTEAGSSSMETSDEGAALNVSTVDELLGAELSRTSTRVPSRAIARMISPSAT